MSGVISDLRFALRHFSRTPLASLTMIAVLAIGIGVNSALFLFIYSLANAPLAGATPDPSTVRIRGIDRSTLAGVTIGREFSYDEYREYATQSRLFSTTAAWTSSDVVIDVGSGGENLQSGAATYVTRDYFSVLGVRPALGAALPRDGTDTGAPELVAVISHTVWDRFFGQSPDVIGRTVTVNNVPVTIVGVAPRRFNGARTGGSQVRVWLPLNARAALQRTAVPLTSDDAAIVGAVARLQPGITRSDATSTVQAIAAQAPRATLRGLAMQGASTDVVTLLADNYFPPSGQEPDILGRVMSLMVPLLILLITCTNVSALMTGLAVARRREIAVRLSLGAARRRIVRQLVTESGLLAIVAGALGLFVIWTLLRVFESSLGDTTIVIDWRGLAYTFGIAIVAGIVFGLSPALHATRVGLSEVLKDAAGTMVSTRSRLQSGLVVAQIALTQPALLAMGAGILEMRDDWLALPSPAFADRILDVRFNINPRYGSMDTDREAALARLRDRLAALPGVVAVVSQANQDTYGEVSVHPADAVTGIEPASRIPAQIHAAPPGYFSLMGLSFLRGRDFARDGGDDAGAIVIGSDLARQLWGSADPIGRRLTGADARGQSARTFVVIGVVDDAEAGLGGARDRRRVFTPTVVVTRQFLIRTEGPAQPMASVIRSVANDEATQVPIVSVNTLAAVVATERRSVMTAVAAVAGSGGVALLLSAIGLYAVVAFSVSQRVREIGIRSALGADVRRIVGLFLVRGMRLGMIGLLLGLTLSVAVIRLMAVARGEDPPEGVVTLAALVAAVVIAVAFLATWIPARRAAQIDPIEALRAE